jgi:tRNA-dihydrouridine synthase
MFVAGGVATPADAAMMMQLGADGVFVGSGIFKSGDPAERAAAIVKATTFFDDPKVIAEVSRARRGHGRHQRRRPAGPAPPRRARLVTSAGAVTASAYSRCRAMCASTPVC